MELANAAPGGPGIAPTWTSSAKDIVGCALGPFARLVHARLRHRQRGLLSARRHPADPRPRLHRRRRPRLLGRGQAAAELHACGCWRRACRRSRSCTRTRASRSRCASHPIRIATCSRSRSTSPATRSSSPYVLLAPRLGTRRHTTTSPRSAATWRAAALTAEQGPFALALAAVDDESARRLRAASAPAMSARATAGRISTATAR